MVRDVVEKVGQKDSKQSALDQHEARSTLCPAPPVVRGRPVSRILAERSTDAPPVTRRMGQVATHSRFYESLVGPSQLHRSSGKFLAAA